MNLVVVPLSNVAPRAVRFEPLVVSTLILMVAIGLPIAAVADGYYSARAGGP